MIKYCPYCNNSLRKSMGLNYDSSEIFYCKNHLINCRFRYFKDNISEIRLYDSKYTVYLIYGIEAPFQAYTEIYFKHSNYNMEQVFESKFIANINPDNFYDKLRTIHTFS